MKVGSNNDIVSFSEKKDEDNSLINGGYFVCEPNVFDYINNGDTSVWEKEPLESLAKQGQLESFFHSGFWRPMDTLRDKKLLEDLWKNDKAPWKSW